MFWAPTETGPVLVASTTTASERYGGQITTSASESSIFGSSSSQNSRASSIVLFIFQLAAISGTRSLNGGPPLRVRLRLLLVKQRLG